MRPKSQEGSKFCYVVEKTVLGNILLEFFARCYSFRSVCTGKKTFSKAIKEKTRSKRWLVAQRLGIFRISESTIVLSLPVATFSNTYDKKCCMFLENYRNRWSKNIEILLQAITWEFSKANRKMWCMDLHNKEARANYIQIFALLYWHSWTSNGFTPPCQDLGPTWS